MVGLAYKGVFITPFEAIRNFVLSTVFYGVIIFFRELSSWLRGMKMEEILTPTSYKLLLIYASVLYFIFLVSLGYSGYKSYKHHREKKRYLKDYKSN